MMTSFLLIRFLLVYGAANLVLGLTYLVLAGMRATRTRVSHRFWLRLAQSLLVISLLAPVVFRALPEMPTATVREFAPLDGAATQAHHVRPKLVRMPAILAIERASFRVSSEELATPALALVLLLGLGVGLHISRRIRDFARLRMVLRDATVIRTIGRVRIVISDRIQVPFSALVARTRYVALPEEMLARAKDRALATRHELQHHRQGDTYWVLALEVLVSFFFWNPAIWFWKSTMVELQEFACDEALLLRKGISSRDYGSCLVRVAEAALRVSSPHVGTTCMATHSKYPWIWKSLLRRRIEMFNRNQESRPRWARQLSTAVLGTVALVVCLGIVAGVEASVRKGELGKINPGAATYDPRVQAIAQAAIGDAVKSYGAKAGIAIVAEPMTGRILAVAAVDTTGRRPKSWALSTVMEPASFMKAIVAAGAIERGATTPDEKHNCENGKYLYGGVVYHDWRSEGWRSMTTTETIAKSGDICAIKIGEKVGVSGLKQLVMDFGFGPGGTASTFPGARSGHLLTSEVAGEVIPEISTGFGMQVTTLELVQAFGAIANGGRLLEPKTSDDSSAPKEVRRVLTSENALKMKEILRAVVQRGTAAGRANSDLVSTAGKTATSYIPDLTQWDLVEGKKNANLAGFIGFAPVEAPKIEVYVAILDPADKTGAHGSTHAAPVFKRITEEVIRAQVAKQ